MNFAPTSCAPPRVFPCALLLEGRRCLVIGSTDEGLRRVRSLLDAGALVRAVAERPSSELLELSRTHAIELATRRYVSSDLDGCWLVVLADRDPLLAREVGRGCEALCCFFCAIDQPEANSFSHMARIEAGLLTVAVATRGAAPALALRLKRELERLFTEAGMARFVESLARLRASLQPDERRAHLGRLMSGLHIEGRVVLPPVSAPERDSHES